MDNFPNYFDEIARKEFGLYLMMCRLVFYKTRRSFVLANPNYTEQRVYNWEIKGDSVPIEHLKDYTEALKIPPEEFINEYLEHYRASLTRYFKNL